MSKLKGDFILAYYPDNLSPLASLPRQTKTKVNIESYSHCHEQYNQHVVDNVAVCTILFILLTFKWNILLYYL